MLPYSQYSPYVFHIGIGFRVLCFMLQRVILWAIVWMAGLSVAVAQRDCDCFVQGRITDQETGLPIPGAIIYIKEVGKEAISDLEGNYLLEHICEGHYILTSQMLGYQSVETSITLNHTAALSSIQQNLALHSDHIHLKDVVITAKRAEPATMQATSNLTGAELDQTRGLSLGESLKSMVGVTTLQTGSTISKPVIHGLHSNRILILNNGVRQEGQQWGSEHAPEIDPFVANRISIVKGAAGVRYGSDAIGGVIVVEPNDLPVKSGMAGELDLVGFSNGRQGVVSGRIEGGFPKLAGLGWRIQGTLKKGGNVRTPNYFLANTGVSENNFSAALGYKKDRVGLDIFYSQFSTKIGIFSGSHIGSTSDLDSAIARKEPLIQSGFRYRIERPYQDISHHLVKAHAFWKPSGIGKLDWTLARQYNYRAEYDLHRKKNDTKPELLFELTTYSTDLLWTHPPIARKLSGTVGITGNYQFNIMGGRPLIPNFRNYSTGLFWIERYTWNKWELEMGLRYDYRFLQVFQSQNRTVNKSEYTFSNFSGTIGASYKLNERWSVRSNLGTAWRSPSVNELFSDGVHHGEAVYIKGNASLQPERALNWITSLTYAGNKLGGELSFYNNYIQNYIYQKPDTAPRLTILGAFPAFNYTQANALFRGLDASATWKPIQKLSLTSKISLIRVQNLSATEYLVFIPANRYESSLRYQWEKVGKLKRVFMGLGNLFVDQQRRTPAQGDYAPAPEGYMLWNANAGLTVPLKNQSLNVSVGVTNLFNTVYRDYLNRFRYYADEVGRNVSLRLKWTF